MSNSSRLEGQVVHIRKVSKKLIFLDVEHFCGKETVAENKRTTVVLKSWECGGESAIKAVANGGGKIHAGDVVSFVGYFENCSDTFSAVGFEIKELFAEKWPGQTFLPKPPDDCENCAQGECKYFLNTGYCPKTFCKFRHSQNNIAGRVNYVAEKKQRRFMVHEEEEQKNLIGSSQRAAAFADWIVANYGQTWLAEGLILDVGGGRGDLAFELTTKRGLSCAVVDPRPTKLKRWQVKYLKKHPDAKISTHYETQFNKEFISSVKISDIKLVVGLHPDEATEPLVSIALNNNLNFCVIPCCVFSSLFPNRRLKDGNVPTSYEHFCQYLREMNNSIKEETLPFVGKNKVLFINRQS